MAAAAAAPADADAGAGAAAAPAAAPAPAACTQRAAGTALLASVLLGLQQPLVDELLASAAGVEAKGVLREAAARLCRAAAQGLDFLVAGGGAAPAGGAAPPPYAARVRQLMLYLQTAAPRRGAWARAPGGPLDYPVTLSAAEAPAGAAARDLLAACRAAAPALRAAAAAAGPAAAAALASKGTPPAIDIDAACMRGLADKVQRFFDAARPVLADA